MTKCACSSVQPTRRSKKWRGALAFWVSAVGVARRQLSHHCNSDRIEYRRRHKLYQQTSTIHIQQDFWVNQDNFHAHLFEKLVSPICLAVATLYVDLCSNSCFTLIKLPPNVKHRENLQKQPALCVIRQLFQRSQFLKKLVHQSTLKMI